MTDPKSIKMSLYKWIQCAIRIKKPIKTAFSVQHNSDIIEDMPKFISQHKQFAETLYDIKADNHTSDLSNNNNELYNDSYDDNDKHMHFLTH